MTAAGSCSSGICNLEREYLFCASKHGQVELGVVAKNPGRRGKLHTLLERSYLLKKPRLHLKLCSLICYFTTELYPQELRLFLLHNLPSLTSSIFCNDHVLFSL